MIALMSKLGERASAAQYPPMARARFMYEKAVFVPVGRGSANTECLRITEALSCGALPVIVVSHEERDFAYGTLGRFEDCPDRLPPFIFATSWGEAVQRCTALLAGDKARLDAMQHEAQEWWAQSMDVVLKMMGTVK